MSEDMALLSRIILTSASKQPPVALTPAVTAGQGTLTATVLKPKSSGGADDAETFC
jgi:hypothetical protein